MKQINVGILGAGYMAGVHAANLKSIPGVEIVAICDQDEKKAHNLAQSIENANIKVFVDFDHMLSYTKLDTLFVCIPPFAHQGQVETAAQQGIHIFIEKPVSLDSVRAKSMVEAVRKSGVFSQVGYHMRFGTAVKELKRLIDQGEAGMATLFDGRYDCNSLHSPWWIEKDKCGGQVFEQAIHTYDMAAYLLGEPRAAAGFISNLCHMDIERYTIEDTSAAIVSFKSGAMANICASNNAVPMKWNCTFTVICQKVTAHFEDPNTATLIFTGGKEVCSKRIEGNANMYLDEVKAFISAIRGEEPNTCTIVEGLNSLNLVESVVKSSESGEIILLESN